MSWLSLETILEIIKVLILILLVLRWIKKYHAKKNEEKIRKLTSIIVPNGQASFVQEFPMGYLSELPMNSYIQTTRALTHNKQHVNEEREESPIGLSAFRM